MVAEAPRAAQKVMCEFRVATPPFMGVVYRGRNGVKCTYNSKYQTRERRSSFPIPRRAGIGNLKAERARSLIRQYTPSR
jgi:hypothetical protein